MEDKNIKNNNDFQETYYIIKLKKRFNDWENLRFSLNTNTIRLVVIGVLSLIIGSGLLFAKFSGTVTKLLKIVSSIQIGAISITAIIASIFSCKSTLIEKTTEKLDKLYLKEAELKIRRTKSQWDFKIDIQNHEENVGNAERQQLNLEENSGNAERQYLNIEENSETAERQQLNLEENSENAKGQHLNIEENEERQQLYFIRKLNRNIRLELCVRNRTSMSRKELEGIKRLLYGFSA
ncbi:hypothetical protein C2G38_2244784 [Gigaspora rosea]|uniref:Uncharacterized protein n=1 Tax=Gigaspora rosea TaxID=44941 RepID=A0A397VDI4_9GLOM|nr:hypothetical protein C2G38_2244784 [Gigaspora rosea]